jgi:hypothetical protein
LENLKVENLMGIEKPINIWQPCNGSDLKTIMLIVFGSNE